MTNPLQNSITKTLLWFSLTKSPLTPEELFDRLHDKTITPAKLQTFLKTNPPNLIQQKNLITLKSHKSDITSRIQNQAHTKTKWQLIQASLPLFQTSPFTKAILISGSVSAGNADKNSDIDLFIITQPNRIWLARLFLLLTLKNKKLLRQEQKAQISNLFCPNHFISENHLLLKPHNLFTAHLFSQFAPLTNPDLCEKLRQKNLPWIHKFLPNSSGQTKPPFPPSSKTISIWEILLFGPFGFLAEQLAKFIQLKKIISNSDFQTKFKTGGLKFSKTQLTFHGKPQEPQLLQKFSHLQKSLTSNQK